MAGGGGRSRTQGRRQASGVDLDDAAFRKALPGAIANISLRTERDLLRLGLMIQNEARKLAPVDTGRLRSSIMAVPGTDGRGPYVNVGSNLDYAPYVEYGTASSAAQPYMRPALLLAARQWAGLARGRA